MLNLLNTLRYFVFVVFLVCNAVITSVAVWNLSLVEAVVSQSNAKHTDGLLIFVGASGLVLIFTVLFFELYGSNGFICRVWFELVWVAIYCILELAGAATYTALSSSQTCDDGSLGASGSATLSSGACASTQVLQAFTWISATLLLGYFTFLTILTLVKRKDDPTIWHCLVRRFPVANNHNLKSAPESPAYPRFRASEDPDRGGDVPVIAAPQPRRAPGTREPVLSYNSGLSYRSGLGLEYEIEHYQSPESVLHGASTETDHHGAGARSPDQQRTSHNAQRLSKTSQLSDSASPPSGMQPLRAVRPLEPVRPARQPPQPIVSTPFYHASVVSAVEDQQPTRTRSRSQAQAQAQAQQPQAPKSAMVKGGKGGGSQVRRLPPSPPPLGDWPRMDATSRPTRIKRKPLPRPEPEPDRYEGEGYEPEVEPEPERLVLERTRSSSHPQSSSHAHSHSHSQSESHSHRPHPQSQSNSHSISHSHSHSQSRHEKRVLPVPTRTLSQSRPQPQPPLEPAQVEPQAEPPSSPPPPQPQLQVQVQRQSRPLPPTQPTMIQAVPSSSSTSYPLDASALSAALQPLHVSQSMRSKPSRPSGPRRGRKSNSIDDGRPAELELSRTAQSRTFVQSSGYS